MADGPNVRLNVSSRPENVLLVRQALNGLAETIGLDPLELNDISTAVSEACNNVALHAYAAGEGPLELEVHVRPEDLEVVVRDQGVGIHPRLDDAAAGRAGGIGLPIMLALAQNVEFSEPGGSGTEVRLTFATTHRRVELERPQPFEYGFEYGHDQDRSRDPRVPVSDVTKLALAPAALARTVLPRVLSALAARAFFSTDRISDAQLLADALAAEIAGAGGGEHLSVAVTVAPRRLELRVGPLPDEHARALTLETGPAGLGSVLARLTDAHTIHDAGSQAVLAMTLADGRPG